MKYFKNTTNQIFAYDENQISQGHGKDLIAITQQEAMSLANPPPTAQQQRELRITELKRLLAESDYKVLPDYDKPDEDIVSQRQAWREEIRTLEAQ